MKRKIMSIPVVSLIVIGAASFFATRSIALVLRNQLDKVVPFTIRQSTFVSSRDGALPAKRLLESSTTAVRSDRAVSTTRTAPKSNGEEGERGIILPDTSYFWFNIPLELISSGHHSASMAEMLLARRSASVNCLNSTAVRLERFVGLDAILSRKTYIVQYNLKTHPLHQVMEWRAPELNCFPLKHVMTEQEPDGTFRQMNEMNTIDITVGREPDSSLFAVPTTYREVPPSEQERAWLARIGEPIAPGFLVRWKRVDAQYTASRR